jgi:magnesium transporter
MNIAPTDEILDAEQPERDRKPWFEMVRLAEQGSADELESFVVHLSTSEQALALSRLDDAETERVFKVLDSDDAAELISHLSETQAAQAISVLDADTAAAIVHELPSDEQADVLGDLDQERADAILDSLPEDEAATVRELAAYEDDVAGGLMVREFLRFTDQMTVAEVIEELSQRQDDYDHYDIRYGYVCDSRGRLVGVLPMGNLLFVKRSQRVADVMVRRQSVPRVRCRRCAVRQYRDCRFDRRHRTAAAQATRV